MVRFFNVILRIQRSIMKVSEISVAKVFMLTLEDSVAKALHMMYENNINQILIIDDYGDAKYIGMIYAKQFLDINAPPTSKLKSFVVNTPVLSSDDNIEKCAQLIVATGNRALPVVEKGKLIGIVSETDVVLTSDFGHSRVDEVMSGAIVIEENDTLGNALSKMRRYNISRLPVINSRGILTGTINALDITKIIATPRERAGKSPGIGTMAVIREVKIKDIMRRAVSVERGTTLNTVIGNFKEAEEIIVVGNRRPIGVVTPKDALELTLPKRTEPTIHIAHLNNDDARKEIEEQMTRFLKKIQGKLENVLLVIVYADMHKTHKYSVRARIITTEGVVAAKAVGYDPLSACKELISRLDRRIRSEHSQKIEDRQHRKSTRKIS
jgi:predicted transcriptional regulator/ribosome-associated translation inhibitor RaiA